MLHYGRLMRGFLLITSRVMTPEKTDGVNKENTLFQYAKTLRSNT